MKKKACSKCGVVKGADGFNKSKSSRDGLRSDCRSCQAETSRAWYEKNKDWQRERCLENYRQNKEGALRRNKEWRLKNRERRLEINRACDARNREKRRAYNSMKHRLNPEMQLLRGRRYRERLEAVGGEVPQQTRLLLLSIQEGRCFYCLIDMSDTPHVDHVLPLIRGGNNDLSNLVMCCKTCNSAKGPKTIDEYAPHLISKHADLVGKLQKKRNQM